MFAIDEEIVKTILDNMGDNEQIDLEKLLNNERIKPETLKTLVSLENLGILIRLYSYKYIKFNSLKSLFKIYSDADSKDIFLHWYRGSNFNNAKDIIEAERKIK